jgi:hypothetical protein
MKLFFCVLLFLSTASAYLDPASSEKLDNLVHEERRVWVKYKDGQRSGCLESLSSFSARSMPAVKVHHEFDFVDSFIITATVEEINELAQDPAVEEILEDPKRYPMHIPESMKPRELQGGEEIPYGIRMVQATEAHASGFTGAGAKVCVVDTVRDQECDILTVVWARILTNCV